MGFYTRKKSGAGNTYIAANMDWFTPDPDGTSNAGVGTVDIDDGTVYREYLRWTSDSAGQDMTWVWHFQLPSGFGGWIASDALSIDVRTNDSTNNAVAVSLYQGDKTVDPGISSADFTPSSDDTWETITDQPTGDYSAGDWVTLHIKCSLNAADDTIDIARVVLKF